MEVLVLMYAILGGITFLALGLILIVVAGRDIVFAFQRRFSPQGCDVFLINSNRHVNHHYLKPVDGCFKIENKIYITNPNKLEGLSDNMLVEIKKAKDKKIKNIQIKIDELTTRQDFIKKQIDSLPDTQENINLISQLSLHHQKLGEHISLLHSKLKIREQRYFMNRRGAYFYIENDPVPKDFYEFYTEMDSTQIENVIMRAQTKDPKSLEFLEKHLVWIKRFLIFALIAGAIGAFFAFKNSSGIDEIAKHAGISLSV